MTPHEPTPLHEPKTSITLESVKSQFAQWRAARVKGNRIPNALWEAAIQLTKQYDSHQIAFELKLNLHRLRDKIKEKSNQAHSSPAASDFVKVSLPPLSSPQSQTLEQKIFFPRPVGTLELIRPDGTILKASGLDPKDVCSFIKGFLDQ